MLSLITIKTTSFDELKAKLDQLRKNAEAINGSNDVQLPEVMPDTFMHQYTEFFSLEAIVGCERDR